jgi:SAM-dependent methyltransferase
MSDPIQMLRRVAVEQTIGRARAAADARRRGNELLARHGSVEALLEEVECPVCDGAPAPEAFRARTQSFSFFPLAYQFRHRRCEGCGLVFVSPRLRPEVLRELYEQDYVRPSFLSAANVEKKGRDAEAYARHLRGFAPPDTHPRLLDVGAGHGPFVVAAAHEGWDVSGQEFADLSELWDDVPVLRGRIRVAALEDESVWPTGGFDVVTLWEVAEHLQDPRETFSSVARVLRPGGILALESPRADSVALAYLGPRWTQVIPEQHLYLWTRDSLSRLLSELGFEVLEVRDAVTPRDAFTGRIHLTARRADL